MKFKTVVLCLKLFTYYENALKTYNNIDKNNDITYLDRYKVSNFFNVLFFLII